MFDKKNQGYVDAINSELLEIKDKILTILNSSSSHGEGFKSIFADIEARIDKIDVNLDKIGLGWASKNTQVRDMRHMVRKLSIMFNGLVKDISERHEKAKRRDRKFAVSEKNASDLREKWSIVANKVQNKIKLTEEKRDSREGKRERLKNLFIPFNFDSKEDYVINSSKIEEERKAKEDRDIVVKLVADEIGADIKTVSKWPDHVLISVGERIMKERESKKDSKGQSGQGPSFE